MFSSKDFQTFLWRFCGISRGYKGSKPKVSISKFFRRPGGSNSPLGAAKGGDRSATWKDGSTGFGFPVEKSMCLFLAHGVSCDEPKRRRKMINEVVSP